jgi:hypothetical protein
MTRHQANRTRPSRVGAFATVLAAAACLGLAHPCRAQGNDKLLRTKADALFDQGKYAEALPLYSQLVSLEPQDHDLNYRLGACSIYGKDSKPKAIGFLKYAVKGPSTSPMAWYFLGRAYQLDYRFSEAMDAYGHFKGTAEPRQLGRWPIEAMDQQCRNGQQLLSNIKDITVLAKVEVAQGDFFRFYDLDDVGGKIVVTPDELLTPYDRKSGERFLTYLPDGGGPVYFSSYGKNGADGRDIYRSDLLPGGKFSAPVRLAGYVNTSQDEDFPVMSKDGRTFHFCSKGHNSMGGYDVFRCAYDAGMDAFGVPENLDFAVNTPADELLYITDAKGEQACFASDRDSPQGMVNVYRVGTRQAPINISVMQGSFASNFAPSDKKARITVEDAVTHERVADVKTADDGGYLLVVPHGGIYQYMVETGTGERKLLATVDVPMNEAPVAYGQEMRVSGPTGEKLEITTHFGQPLQGDVMALALDEIKRRARLDVTGERMQPVAATLPVNVGDPLAAAGFDGTVTMADAARMAREEAAARRTESDEQGRQAVRSYALALASLEQAEAQTAHAGDLVRQAGQATDSTAARALLYQAAEQRAQAEDANLRAKAAYRAGIALDSTAQASGRDAARAATVANAVGQGIHSGNKAGLTDALKQLKQDMDLRNGPAPRLSSTEALRREAKAATDRAAKKLDQARTAREEENEFASRVDSKRREAATAKGGKKGSAERQLADMQQPLAALHEEADEAFSKARASETAATAARGTAELAKYLDATPAEKTAAPSAEQLTGMAGRIGQVEQANAALHIPEMYRPVVNETAEQRMQRLFDWSVKPADGEGLLATTTARDAGDPVGSAGTVTTRAEPSTAPVVPLGPVGPFTAERMNARDSSSTTDDQAVLPPGTRVPEAVSDVDTGMSVPDAAPRQIDEPSATGQVADPGIVDLAEQSPSQGESTVALAPEEQAFFAANALAELKQLRASAPDRQAKDSLDALITAKQEELAGLQREAAVAAAGQQAGEQPDKVLEDGMSVDTPEASTPGDTAAARGAAEDLANLPEEQPEAGASEARRRVSFEELDFDPSMLDQELINELVPGFAWLQSQADSMEDPVARESALAGLEQRLVDSIDARSATQRAWSLEHPEDSAKGTARLARLERLKTERKAEAVAMEEAPVDTSAVPGGPVSGLPVSVSPTVVEVVRSGKEEPASAPSAALAQQAENAYEQRISFPAKEADKERSWSDSARFAVRLREAAVDSMQEVLGNVRSAQERGRLQKELDGRKAELLALKVDLGHRSGHWLPQLYLAAMDSLHALRSMAGNKGVPAETSLMRSTSVWEDSARTGMARAQEWRTLGDGAASDTVRDQWYRLAWSAEAKVFRQLDSAATLWNYLLLPDVDPAAVVSYAEVESRLASVAEQSTVFQAPVSAEVEAQDQAEPMVEQVVPPAPATPRVNADSARIDAGVPEALSTDTASATASDRVVPMAVETAPPLQGTDPAASGTGSQAAVLPAFVDRHYQFTPESRSLLDADREAKAFLVMQASAMQHADSAQAILAMANSLTGQAAAAHMKAAAARTSDAAGSVRLEAHARALDARSDSLRFQALKQDHAAHLDHAAAQRLLEELPAARSAAIASLESSCRRAEVPQLADAWPTAGGGLPAGPTLGNATPAGNEALVQRETEVASNLEPVLLEVAQPSLVDRGSSSAVDTASPMPPAVPPATLPSSPVEVAAPAGPLEADRFDWMPEGSRRTAPIPIDVPKPGGVVYSVQIGAFRNALPMEAFMDLAPVSGEQVGNGLTRYTAGLFTSAENAAKAGESVRSRGYRDAFVVAYLDGRRISLREAMAAERGTPRPALPEVPPTAVASAEPSVSVDTLRGAGAEAAALLRRTRQAS